jgi:hypothetical protein
MLRKLFDQEPRIIFARPKRGDTQDLQTFQFVLAIGDEENAGEAALLHALTDRGKRQVVVDAVDAAKGDAV